MIQEIDPIPCIHIEKLQKFLRDECLWVYGEDPEVDRKVNVSCKECAQTIQVSLCQIYAGKKKMNELDGDGHWS